MKSVASSTPVTQSVDILLLTPGNDACICLTGTKKLTSAHTDEFVHSHWGTTLVYEHNTKPGEDEDLECEKGITHKQKYT